MKNIHYILAIFTLLTNNIAFGQSATAKIKGTIVKTSADAVMIRLKSNETFSGQMTNLQFTIQVPNTVSPKPTLTIKSNPNAAYVPSANYLREDSNEGGYYNFLFGATTVGSPFFSFVANAEIDILEIKFSGANVTTEVRLAQLPNGGATTQKNFYIEIAQDNTDQAAMFYGTGATNNSLGYAAYSYVPIANIVLPVKFTSFTATKKDNDAILNWFVENESTTTQQYEVERSIDGTTFEKIKTIAPLNNGSSSNNYNLTDENLSSIKSNGIIYYRIKQIDNNGKFTYTEIRSVKLIDKAGMFSTFPNPAHDFTTVKIEVEAAGQIALMLVNADGKQVQTINLNAQKGINLKKIDLANIAAGSYLIKTVIAGEMKTVGLVKL